ncbi:MAG: hypothetical protein U0324_11895 [Polyangiales bacterium]
MTRLALAALLLAASLGCWNYRSQLDRAEEHYRAGRYGEAVTNLSDLEHALGDLDRADRARYGYVRGLSHAHLGQRADARHWLAVTREMIEAGAPLPDTDRADLQRALTEADWVPTGERAADAGAPSVPSGTEPVDTAPPRAAERRNTTRE